MAMTVWTGVDTHFVGWGLSADESRFISGIESARDTVEQIRSQIAIPRRRPRMLARLWRRWVSFAERPSRKPFLRPSRA